MPSDSWSPYRHYWVTEWKPMPWHSKYIIGKVSPPWGNWYHALAIWRSQVWIPPRDSRGLSSYYWVTGCHGIWDLGKESPLWYVSHRTCDLKLTGLNSTACKSWGNIAWVFGNRLKYWKFEKYMSALSLCSWNITECDVKPKQTNNDYRIVCGVEWIKFTFQTNIHVKKKKSIRTILSCLLLHV